MQIQRERKILKRKKLKLNETTTLEQKQIMFSLSDLWIHKRTTVHPEQFIRPIKTNLNE